MKKSIFIYGLVLLLSTILLTGCTKKTEEEIKTDDTVVEEKESEEGEEETQEDEEESEDLGYISDDEGFTKEKQSLGESSTYEYEIEDITDSQEDGYHEFLFTVTSENEEAIAPLFVVEPIWASGVIKVTVSNIFGDSSDVSLTKGITIDKGAISTLTRTVTSIENTRIYGIGVSGTHTFKLELDESSDSTWIFSLKVSYDTKYSPPTIDFGSTEFSSDLQSIEGVTSSEGTKITNYSYIYSGGVLKFSLEVSSGASNPIPSVSGEYNESGVLEVTFPSLELDKVAGWTSSKSKALAAGVTLSVSRSGESSTYSFTGISSNKPFKLSASQSPNLVIIEIDL